jgi:glycosyltransferase involved in cell wall biosynthesis
MRIAINTRFLLSNKMEGFGWYTYEIVSRMVRQQPEHHFYFFFDRPYDPSFVFAENVTPIVLFPPARHPILFIWWFECSVKRALKKHKIDLFFSPDGYLSLGSDVPQIGVIHDINYEHFPKDVPWSARLYLRYFFPRFARKAKHVITVSDYSKKDIAKTYGINPSQITAVWNAASPVFRVLKPNEIQETRTKLTGGNPYFLYVGAIHPRKNVKRLVEAFIVYREQVKNASHRLVIVGSSLWKNKQFEVNIPEDVRPYIIFTGHVKLDELANIMGAASVFTFVSYFEGFGIPLVEAMQCGVPILCGDQTSLPEVANEAAHYCNPFDVKDIANGLIILSESPELREHLSRASLQRATLFSWDQSAIQVWNVIERFLPLK